MEYLLYPFAGLTAAFLGALPPGAVNLSVVYTTLNQDARAAGRIILAAGVGEMILAFFALHCAMAVEHFVKENVFLQYLVAAILVAAGLYLFFRRSGDEREKAFKKDRGFLKGLLLSVLNPPVLVFWLAAFTLLSTKTDLMLEAGVLRGTALFFLGVFVGKLLALQIYLRLSRWIAGAGDLTGKVNRGIGVLLFVVGVVQLVRLVV